ncbi:MAG: hypothetical protein ACREKQ_16645, partial [Candidatus Rokuibacteriota bacterium]
MIGILDHRARSLHYSQASGARDRPHATDAGGLDSQRTGTGVTTQRRFLGASAVIAIGLLLLLAVTVGPPRVPT